MDTSSHFNYFAVGNETEVERPTDPISLISTLRIEDPSFSEVWLPQGDALRAWHEQRKEHAVAISLNTGSGKTFVGLVAAKSLANELRGKVLYLCNTIQLVEQTAEKAAGYGIDVATYFEQRFTNEHAFSEGRAPCITTYHAAFNGKSRFRNSGVSAIIFDDAHTCEQVLRTSYTLDIKKETDPDLYFEITTLFEAYFNSIDLGNRFREIRDASRDDLLFIPPFQLNRNKSELDRILVGHRLATHANLKFAWEYLCEHVHLCCLFISPHEVTLTPPFLPTQCHPLLQQNVRKIFLSATLSAPDAFIRTFGFAPSVLINPTTDIGNCERMILVPSKGTEISKHGIDDTTVAKQLIKNYKALISTPSYKRSLIWSDLATANPNAVTDQVTRFRRDGSSPKLLLVGRYDGLDLPGEICRLMVVDDLPVGQSILEKYLFEKLRIEKTFRSLLVSRFVQSLGRISRGRRDHGVYILTGNRLIRWLIEPKTQQSLPPFLGWQLNFGVNISSQQKDTQDFAQRIDDILARQPFWVEAYDRALEGARKKFAAPTNDPADQRLAEVEALFARQYWQKDYEKAAKCLHDFLDEAYSTSNQYAAWLELWLGYCLEQLGSRAEAAEHYAHATKNQPSIPPERLITAPDSLATIPLQIRNVEAIFGNLSSSAFQRHFDRASRDTALLSSPATSNRHEEALRSLGTYLGFEATRPDNETGEGPDVLWRIPSVVSIGFELKTGKKMSCYHKDDLGQIADHRRWASANLQEDIEIVFVGPILKACAGVTPDSSFSVIELAAFGEVRETLLAALSDAQKTAQPLFYGKTLNDLFLARKLLAFELVTGLPRHPLVSQ